jgi:hypothetical protein
MLIFPASDSATVGRVSKLLSMVVPLETLGGTWPEAPDPSALEVLGLLVLAPALAFAIIWGIAQVQALAGTGQRQNADVIGSQWVGAKPGAEPGSADPRRAATGSTEEPGRTGGASARW